MTAAVIFENVSKSYHTGAGQFQALLPIDLRLEAGEFVGLVGPSGSGKSTLLNLLSGIDHPSGGRVTIAGKTISDLSESDLAAFRAHTFGHVLRGSFPTVHQYCHRGAVAGYSLDR